MCFNAIVDEIVKEWELRTKSSFTPWMTEKNFGNIGVSLHIYFSGILLLFSFVVLNQSGTHQIKLPNATLQRKADFCVKIKRSLRFLQRIWKYMNVPGESGGERDR